MNDSSNNGPSLKSLAVRGVAFNWIGRGISVAITFFLTPFLLKYLGDEDYGLWSIVMSLTGYYALADLGIRTSTTKLLAEAHATGAQNKVNRLVSTSLFLYGILSVVVVSVAIVIALAFQSILIMERTVGGEISVVILLTGLSFAIQLFAQPFASILHALARFDFANSIAVMSQLASAVTMATVVAFGGGLTAMAVATLVLALLTQMARVAAALHLCPTLAPSRRYISATEIRSLASFGVHVASLNVLGRISLHSLPLIVGSCLGTPAVAIFAIAESLVRKSARLMACFPTVIMPLASRLNATGKQDSLARLTKLVNRLMQAASWFIGVTLFFLGDHFLDLWIGPGYGQRTHSLLMLLAATQIATATAGGIPSTMIGMGLIRPLRNIAIVDLVMSIGIGFLLTYYYGLVGTGIALFVTRLTSNAILTTLVMTNSLGMSWRAFWAASTPHALASVIPVALYAATLRNHFLPTTLWTLVPHFLVLGVIFVISTFLFCVPSDLKPRIMSLFLPVVLRTSKHSHRVEKIATHPTDRASTARLSRRDGAYLTDDAV